MKTITHEEMLNKHLGKKGTEVRDNYEAQLQADILAYQLKELRKKKKLSQQSLADLVGFDKTQISKIEHGKRNLTLETITKIVQAMGARIQFSIIS